MKPIINLTDIILASASPRREALLKGMGLKFRVIAPAVEDGPGFKHILNSKKPYQYAVKIAKIKAQSIGSWIKDDAIIISADTIVVMQNRIIGKPKNNNDAKRILRLLSGKTHSVITGVCILKKPQMHLRCFHVTTKVKMSKLTAKEIGWYVKTREPMDKAGAYGIQGIGGLFVEKINGSYTNVVGFPTAELLRALKKL